MEENTLDYSALQIAHFRQITDAQDAFINTFFTGQYGHAYLVSGDKGCGKKQLCLLLTAHLLGSAEDSVDLLRVSMERVNAELGSKNTASIGVAAVKRMIVPFISAMSMFQNPRVVLIEQADLLTEQAQNALLKSLEEPVSKAVFFLITEDLSKIITTIKSRCQKVYIHRWPRERVREYLAGIHVAEEKAEQIAAASNGLIEEALYFVHHEAELLAQDAILQKLLHIQSLTDIIIFASEHAKMDAQSQDDILNRFEVLAEQAMQRAAGRSLESCGELSAQWEQAVCAHRTESFLRIIKHIMHARRMKNNQMNWQACLDYMLANILEEINKWQSS